MNCRDVREYLDRSPNIGHIEENTEVHLHLETCLACSAEAERVHRLQQVFQKAAVDDTDHLRSPAAIQVEVAARLVRRRNASPRRWRQHGLGLAAAAGLAALAFLAPWQMERADGYKLSFEGVSVELAGDHERLCDLLFALGAVNAGVDVGECDTTCQVVIWDLRTRDEARLVEAAIRRLSSGEVTVDVIPVRYRSAEG